MRTPSPETPPQMTFTPKRFLVAAIVAAVVALNVVLIAFIGYSLVVVLVVNVLVTPVTTVVVLSIFGIARHPKSNATWVTTGINALGIGVPPSLASVIGNDRTVMSILAVLYPVTLLCFAIWLSKDRGASRTVRHYQLWSWSCWVVFVFTVALLQLILGGQPLMI